MPRINHLLRTVSPRAILPIAEEHDASIFDTFCEIFGIAGQAHWDARFHRISDENVKRQSQLPIRLAGCGLRNSSRTSRPAYWASFADSLKGICDRFPRLGSIMLNRLNACYASRDPDMETVESIRDAECAGRWCHACGWGDRPSWNSLASGARPPEPDQNEVQLGEWRHGWQYHASAAVEQNEFDELMQAVALPNRRRNAASVHKARMQSCRGRFAGAWLQVAPSTEALQLRNIEMMIAMKRRLGLAVNFEGLDRHGHAALATNNGSRFNARHTGWLNGWKQVLGEAGGSIHDRNVERLLRRTHIPVPGDDDRRLDLVVPGLNVAGGRPLFCDVTVVSPISGNGVPHGGTSNRGGSSLESCERENNQTYHEVRTSGVGVLYCLGAEVYGRMSRQCVELLPELARERSRGVHPRLRRSIALGLQHRWSGILSVNLQRAVSHIIAADSGADLVRMVSEAAPPLADLVVL